MEGKKETFPEKTYKHFITSGILRYPVTQMEMIKERLKQAAKENDKDDTKDKD